MLFFFFWLFVKLYFLVSYLFCCVVLWSGAQPACRRWHQKPSGKSKKPKQPKRSRQELSKTIEKTNTNQKTQLSDPCPLVVIWRTAGVAPLSIYLSIYLHIYLSIYLSDLAHRRRGAVEDAGCVKPERRASVLVAINNSY